MPSNAGLALYFNLLAFAAARLRGYRCAVHHHIYKYLDRYDWRMKVLDRLLGTNGLHIVLCPHMEQRLRDLYGCRAPIAIVPSTVQLLQSSFGPAKRQSLPATPPQTFRIGHISNLQVAKGLDLVIEVLRVLRRRDRNVQLILAGPIQSKLESRMIEEAQQEFGDLVDYRGPVYHEEKQRFFADIHVKLFPTRYPDAQPLVITESFAFGRPVLSYGRGCIPGMIGPATDWSIAPTDDFVVPAVRQIEAWIDDPQAYANASQLARQRYDCLLAEARAAFDDFTRWVCGEAADDFVHRRPVSE